MAHLHRIKTALRLTSTEPESAVLIYIEHIACQHWKYLQSDWNHCISWQCRGVEDTSKNAEIDNNLTQIVLLVGNFGASKDRIAGPISHDIVDVKNIKLAIQLRVSGNIQDYRPSPTPGKEGLEKYVKS